MRAIRLPSGGGFLAFTVLPATTLITGLVTFPPAHGFCRAVRLPGTTVHRSLRRACLHTFAVGLALVAGAADTGVCAAASAPRGAAAPAPGVIRGVVWNADNSPLPNGKVRLRDVSTGRVEGQTMTTGGGEFVFNNVHSALYVAELVDKGGNVIAVGSSFRVDAGAIVTTFIRLLPRRSWLAGAFSNSAGVVIAAAAGAGVTAIGAKAPPVSPQ
jgi:hypothetical protein